MELRFATAEAAAHALATVSAATGRKVSQSRPVKSGQVCRKCVEPVVTSVACGCSLFFVAFLVPNLRCLCCWWFRWRCSKHCSGCTFSANLQLYGLCDCFPQCGLGGVRDDVASFVSSLWYRHAVEGGGEQWSVHVVRGHSGRNCGGHAVAEDLFLCSIRAEAAVVPPPSRQADVVDEVWTRIRFLEDHSMRCKAVQLTAGCLALSLWFV